MIALRFDPRRRMAGRSAPRTLADLGLLVALLLTGAPTTDAASASEPDASRSSDTGAMDAPENDGLPYTTAGTGGEGTGADDEPVIAALTELPLPRYATPTTSAALGWARHFGAVRSSTNARGPSLLAPSDHVGLTASSSPRLWWRLVEDTRHALQVTLVDEAAIDPLIRVELPGPHARGLDSIDLGRRGVALEPGVEYRWYVSVLVDPDRPSRNPTAAGAVERLASDDDRLARARGAEGAGRGHTLAELGIWYDAFDFFARAAATRPDEARVTRHRDHMATYTETR